METAETVVVTLLDIEAIKTDVAKLLPLKEGDEYQIDTEALYDGNVLIDPDCCYYFMCPRLEGGKVQNVWDVPVRTKRAQPGGGYRLSMEVEFYFPILAVDLSKYFKDVVSLKTFMGSRYNYNPRITRNTREFLDAVNRQTQTHRPA